MTDGGDSYLLNLGIQGNEALETLRAILAQMRENNRTAREMVTHLEAISQSMTTMAAATLAATNAIRSEGTATREAIVAHQGRAAAIEMETRRLVQAEQAMLRYQAADRSPVGSSDPLMMGTSGYDRRRAALAAQQAQLMGLTVGQVGGGGVSSAALMQAADPLTMTTKAVEEQTKAVADNNRGWMRHLSWFVQGTVIYMGLGAAINAVRDSLRDLNEVTQAQSQAQVEVGLNMGLTNEELKRQQQLTQFQLQRVGVGAKTAPGLFIEASRTAQTPEELRGLVGAGGMLSALTGQPTTEAIDTVLDLLRQYNLEGSQAQMVTDAVAYSAKVGTDTMNEYAQALSKSGAALRTAGYDFEESVGLIIGLTAGIERSGGELGTFVQQVFTFNDAEIRRLREAGIEPAGRPVRDVFAQAAEKFPGASAQQQQLILQAFGGTRFQADVRTMLEGYGRINQAIQDAANLHGAAAERADEMGEGTKRAAERATAAYQNYLGVISDVLALEERRVGVSRALESMFTKGTLGLTIGALSDTQQRELYQRALTEIDLGEGPAGRRRQQTIEAALEGVGRGGLAERFFGGEVARQLNYTMMQAFMELFESVVAGTKGVAVGTPGQAQLPMLMRGIPQPTYPRAEPAQALNPLMLLSQERFTSAEARGFQTRLEEIDESFRKMGFEPGAPETRQIMVGEGQGFYLEQISSSSLAMEMHLRELRDKSRQLSGVWNLPGQAMVPLESLDFMMTGGRTPAQAASQYQSFIPDVNPIMPPAAPSSERLPLILKDALAVPGAPVAPTRAETDLRSTIETVLQNLFPLLQKERVGNTIENIRIPLIMKGEKMAEAVAQVQGDSFQRSVVAGSKFGGNLPPSVIGSW